jgi:hypothetical protein
MTQEQYIEELKEQMEYHTGMQREYEKLASEHSRKARKLDVEVYELETGISVGATVSVWEVGWGTGKPVFKFNMEVTGINPNRDGFMQVSGFQIKSDGTLGKRFKTLKSWQTVKLEKKAEKVG